jgi:hypothetical protein
MGENWINECRQYLRRLEELSNTKNRDRLDLVRTMRTALTALNHSLWGWIQYVNNPDIMGKFTKEELEEMDDTLNEFARKYIEYDIKITQLGAQKGLAEIKRRRRREDRPSGLVV